MKELKFTVTVHHEEGQIWAEVRELPGCFATGDTIEELQESLTEALALYLPAPEIEVRTFEPVSSPESEHREVIENLRVLVPA